MAMGEVLMWLLFTALLVPAGFVGWVIGHYSGGHAGTRTVTVRAAAPATTTATSTASATTTATATPTTTAAAKTTTAAVAAGSATAGKAVFTSSGCGACHTFAPAGSSSTVGPNLDTAPSADAKTAGMQLAPFVQQSIVDPNAYIAKGFAKGIMPGTFGQQLSKTQLADLVAFIVSGQK
jgi:cytochrome c551/c552